MVILLLAWAPLTWCSNVKGVYLNREVLEGIAVFGTQSRAILGQSKHINVFFSEMVHNIFANPGHMKHAVHQVDRPDCVERALRDSVAIGAD